MSEQKQVASIALRKGLTAGDMTSLDDMLRMKEVAAILRCSLPQSYRLASAGVIPVFRLRGMIRVPRAQLMAFIAQNTTAAAE
jgi:excisionase family DNA binding protein